MMKKCYSTESRRSKKRLKDKKTIFKNFPFLISVENAPVR